MIRRKHDSTTGIIRVFVAATVLAAIQAGAGVATSNLPQVGFHPAGISYWGSPNFGNALWMEDRNWRISHGGNVFSNTAPGQVDNLGNPLSFSTNGGAQYLIAHPGQNNPNKGLFTGRVELRWTGAADIRVGNGSFTNAGSSGAATGVLTNGVRVYTMASNPNGMEVRVYAIQSANPPKNIKLWLPDPANPQGASLVNQTFHPLAVARLADKDWKYIRFMDWLPANASPQQDWVDRRPPGHTFQAGVINPRSPAPGVTNANGTDKFPGPKVTGVAFEHMVALCNASQKSMWVNVPHLATDTFITNLARVVRFGSDANGNPYTSTQANPVHAPLATNLQVFIEYSNEIWSNGGSFPQGDWAAEQGAKVGLSKAQWNARRFCRVWQVFRQVFGGDSRLGKVAAVWTGLFWYTRDFLAEMRSYGPALSPAQEPDIIAPTTYFGNGIQDWVYQKAQDQAGTGDPWFFTGEYFDADSGTNVNLRPVSLPSTNAYWTSTAVTNHMREAFREWTRRLLSGDAQEGAGPDATGVGGGFSQWLVDLARTNFPSVKPIVAYEGGPSLYTDDKDGGDSRDDGITAFIVKMNSQPEFRDVYYQHLNMAKDKGLWSHMMYTATGDWGKFGQWGHLRLLADDPNTSVKYKLMKDFMDEFAAIRHVNAPQGAVPKFDTPHYLPQAYVGVAYNAQATTSGGNGTRTLAIIGADLPGGLSASVVSGALRVTGTPTEVGSAYVYCRVKDADGDPAWRTYSIRVVQRSADPTVTVTFESVPLSPTSSITEPLDVSGYRFTSLAGNQLVVQGATPTNDWNAGWESKVLKTRSWGQGHRVQKANGGLFDLSSMELAAFQGSTNGGSARITGFALGGVQLVKIVNLPNVKKPMTRALLDWVSLEKVEVLWYDQPGGTGSGRNGAIDNLVFNGPQTFSVDRDWWTGIGGTALAALTTNANFPNNPNGRDLLPSLQGANWNNPVQTTNWANSYGQRLYGYLIPESSGQFKFWISGDDNCELWLGTGASYTSRRRIANVPGWTAALQWTKYTNQASGPISLTAGQPYYIEVLHKEGGGSDSVAVGWVKPGQTNAAPSEIIPASVLSAWSAGEP